MRWRQKTPSTGDNCPHIGEQVETKDPRITAFAYDDEKGGWVQCDGASVSRVLDPIALLSERRNFVIPSSESILSRLPDALPLLLSGRVEALDVRQRLIRSAQGHPDASGSLTLADMATQQGLALKTSPALAAALIWIAQGGFGIPGAAFQTKADVAAHWVGRTGFWLDRERASRLKEKEAELDLHDRRYASFIDHIGEDGRVHPSLRACIRTGRWACANPNLQAVPARDGFREQFGAPSGRSLVRLDIRQMELVALAHFLRSRGFGDAMASAIEAGLDLHDKVAASIMGEDLASFQAKKSDPKRQKARKLAKILNFGIPGGMTSPSAFADRCSKEGIDQPSESAFFRYFRQWENAWPDGKAYLRSNGTATYPRILQHLSGRCQHVETPRQASNSFFQGLGADSMSAAAIHFVRRIAAGGDLSEVKLVLAIHDELIFEVPKDKAKEMSETLAQILIKVVSGVLGGLPIEVSSKISKRWD
jgi:hypothetical protein